jgi:hypothetical protein
MIGGSRIFGAERTYSCYGSMLWKVGIMAELSSVFRYCARELVQLARVDTIRQNFKQSAMRRNKTVPIESCNLCLYLWNPEHIQLCTKSAWWQSQLISVFRYCALHLVQTAKVETTMLCIKVIQSTMRRNRQSSKRKLQPLFVLSETQNTFSQALNQHGDKPSKQKTK